MELYFLRRFEQSTSVPTVNPKPVVIGLTTQRHKFEIMRNTGKLRGTKVYIREDASIEMREKVNS